MNFKRTRLSIEEIEQEAKVIADTGIRHILILTKEALAKTPMSYLKEAVGVLKKHFSSIALEIFPMDEEEYRILKKAGAESLPRMTKAKGGIEPKYLLTDIGFVQFMLAWRLFMPRLGITNPQGRLLFSGTSLFIWGLHGIRRDLKPMLADMP